MALSVYQMRPEDCSHSAFYPGEARCPWCGFTRVEIEQMGVPERVKNMMCGMVTSSPEVDAKIREHERWMDSTTFLDAANGIRREVSNIGGKRVVDVRGSEEALTSEQCAALGIGGRELIAQGVIDTVEEARAVGEAMLADLKAGLAAEACAKNGHKFITHRKLCMVCGITYEQCATLERAAHEYVVGRNAIPAVAGEDLFPGDVVTVRDGKAYRVDHMMGGGVSQFVVSKETFDAIMKSGCTGYSIEGKAIPLPSPTLAMLGEQRGKSMDPCEYNMERVGPDGDRSAVKMANLDATHPKPFVHPRSLKGNVNVAPLAVDDPNGDDVSE